MLERVAWRCDDTVDRKRMNSCQLKHLFGRELSNPKNRTKKLEILSRRAANVTFSWFGGWRRPKKNCAVLRNRASRCFTWSISSNEFGAKDSEKLLSLLVLVCLPCVWDSCGCCTISTGFLFLICYAPTSPTLQIQWESIQVVRIDKVARKPPRNRTALPQWTLDTWMVHVFEIVYVDVCSGMKVWFYFLLLLETVV